MPPSPPLRTVQASFPAHGSSLCNASYKTRPHSFTTSALPGQYARRADTPIDKLRPANSLETAPTETNSVVICIASSSQLTTFSRPQRPGGSGLAFAQSSSTLRLINSYLLDYRATLAFSAILYPHPHRLTLRLASPRPEQVIVGSCPSGARYGLTTFRLSDSRG